jgi:erythromycin esterase
VSRNPVVIDVNERKGQVSAAPSEVTEWIREYAVSLKSVTASAGFDDFALLREWIGDARVVGLGEATHSTREFFQLKHRLVEFLVSELGFTLFMLEANFPESLALNRYVLCGEGDSRHSLTSGRCWSWDCDEIFELIEWMRRWNAEHERKVFFYGVDMQTSAPAAMYLLEYLQRHESSAYSRLRDGLLPLAIDPDAREWASRSDAEKEDVREAINDAVATLDALKPSSVEERYELGIARLHAEVLRQREQMWIQQSVEDVRDRAMAENVCALLDLHGPRTKAVIWAHNSHVRAHQSVGLRDEYPPTKMLGQYLRERFLGDYMTFGLAFDHGSFNAEDGNHLIRESTVSSVPGTLDATLADAGPPIFALDLRALPGEVQDWFAQGQASRSIGTFYAADFDEISWTRMDTRALFDALLFVRETSAARLGPCADSLLRDQPAAPEGLVNLDFSAGTMGWRMRRQPSVGPYEVDVASENGRRVLEISRSEKSWPWDYFALSQTTSAAPWRGAQVTARCSVSMEAAHHGSSAQLAIGVLKKHIPPKNIGELVDFFAGWPERLVWPRVATCDAEVRELSVTAHVNEIADTITLALMITGDGRARFGPVTIEKLSGDEANSEVRAVKPGLP